MFWHRGKSGELLIPGPENTDFAQDDTPTVPPGYQSRGLIPGAAGPVGIVRS